MTKADWEIASHGLKWIDYRDFTKDAERAQMVEARPEDEVDSDLDNLLDRLSGLTPGQRRLTALACHTYLNIQVGQIGGQKRPFNF